MNRTKIEWADYAWNPAKGCENRCWYCYGPRICKRSGEDFFTPRFYPERLDLPLKVKQPSKIFVCSMADLFGDWVPDEWIEKVLETVRRCPQHTFQFLTKNPKRYYEFRDKFTKNCWLGTTITGADRQDHDRLAAMTALDPRRISVKFISAEPLLGNVKRLLYPGYQAQDDLKPDWIIVGALTQAKSTEMGKVKREHVDDLITYCDRLHIPVFVKDNIGLAFPRREWPKAKIDYMEYDTDTKPHWAGR